MPTLTTVSTMLDNVQNELRIPVTNTTERAKVAQVMNFVYLDICAKQDWWWLLQSYGRNLKEKIDGGTVNVTEGSTVFVLSSQPGRYGSAVSVVGNALLIPGGQDPNYGYRITFQSSVGDPGLASASFFVGATSTASTYTLYEDFIDSSASGAIKVAKVLQVSSKGQVLERIGIEDMNQLRALGRREGRPQAWATYDFLPTGDGNPGQPSDGKLVWFYPYPDQSYALDFYVKVQETDVSTSCRLPADYQQVLAYGTLARAYPIFLNDLERGTFYQSLFNDLMALMAAQQREYASDHPGVDPGMLHYRNYNTRSRRWGLGSAFDTWPYIP